MTQRSYAGLSYEDVVHRYTPAVASACLMRLNNWADAEDCFQNTFVKLYTSSPSFTDERHLKAWLLRVAINECRNLLRTRGRSLPLEAAASVPCFLDEDSGDGFPAILMQLEPKYREAIYLHYCEGYPIKDIAKILAKNPNTVKTLLHRGREKLRLLYGGECFDET
jgi:RNA polymerase sigma-70 factor (ECF subfamily)